MASPKSNDSTLGGTTPPPSRRRGIPYRVAEKTIAPHRLRAISLRYILCGIQPRSKDDDADKIEMPLQGCAFLFFFFTTKRTRRRKEGDDDNDGDGDHDELLLLI